MGKRKKLYPSQFRPEERDRISEGIDHALGRISTPLPEHTTIRVSDVINPASHADGLIRFIRRGASIEDISDYRYEVLKAVVSYLQIPDRAQLTRKIEMADALIKFVESGEYDKRRNPKPVKPTAEEKAPALHETSSTTSVVKPKKKKPKPVDTSTRPSWLR